MTVSHHLSRGREAHQLFRESILLEILQHFSRMQYFFIFHSRENA